MKALTKVFQYPVDIDNNREFSLFISLEILDLTDGLDIIKGDILNNVNKYIDERIQDDNIPIQSLQCLIASTVVLHKNISQYAQKVYDYILNLIQEHGVDESYEPNSYSDQRNAASATIILYLLILKYKNDLKINTQQLIQKLQMILNYTYQNISLSGGFRMIHDNEVHGGGASLVVLAIDNIQKIQKLLQLQNLDYKQYNIENISFYCLSRHFITFNSRPNKNECLCYMFWIYGCMKILGIQNLLDIQNLRQNVLKLQYEKEFSLVEQATLQFHKQVQLSQCKNKVDLAAYLYQKYHCIRCGFAQNMDKPDLLHSLSALAFLIDSQAENEEQQFDYSVFFMKKHLK